MKGVNMPDKVEASGLQPVIICEGDSKHGLLNEMNGSYVKYGYKPVGGFFREPKGGSTPVKDRWYGIMIRDSHPVEKYIFVKDEDISRLIDKMNLKTKEGFSAHGTIVEQKGVLYQVMVTTVRGN